MVLKRTLEAPGVLSHGQLASAFVDDMDRGSFYLVVLGARTSPRSDVPFRPCRIGSGSPRVRRSLEFQQTAGGIPPASPRLTLPFARPAGFTGRFTWHNRHTHLYRTTLVGCQAIGQVPRRRFACRPSVDRSLLSSLTPSPHTKKEWTAGHSAAPAANSTGLCTARLGVAFRALTSLGITSLARRRSRCYVCRASRRLCVPTATFWSLGRERTAVDIHAGATLSVAYPAYDWARARSRAGATGVPTGAHG